MEPTATLEQQTTKDAEFERITLDPMALDSTLAVEACMPVRSWSNYLFKRGLFITDFYRISSEVGCVWYCHLLLPKRLNSIRHYEQRAESRLLGRSTGEVASIDL